MLSALGQRKKPQQPCQWIHSHDLSAERRMARRGKNLGLGAFVHGFTRTTDSNLTLEKFLASNKQGQLFYLKAAQGRVMAA